MFFEFYRCYMEGIFSVEAVSSELRACMVPGTERKYGDVLLAMFT